MFLPWVKGESTEGLCSLVKAERSFLSIILTFLWYPGSRILGLCLIINFGEFVIVFVGSLQPPYSAPWKFNLLSGGAKAGSWIPNGLSAY